jgi:hypothetical protein
MDCQSGSVFFQSRSGRWPLTAGRNSQLQDVHMAHMAENSGEIMNPFQSSSAVFNAPQLPAVPGEHQVCFRYLSESTRVGTALDSM